MAFGALLLATAPVAAQAEDAGWRLDRVVMVMRHGVRPPTKADPLPAAMVPGPWPTWGVGWGELTAHGAQGVAVLARFDRAHYAGLLGNGCPAPGAVHIAADSDERTIATAGAYVAAMFPGCAVPVAHRPQGVRDPLWSPDEEGLLPPGAAQAAATAALPAGGAAALDAALAPQWQAIDRILDCHADACRIAAQPTTIGERRPGKVDLGGAVSAGGRFAETLALEYAEGKPMAEVGWGHADRATITALLALHAQEFALTARPPAIARVGARALLAQVATGLTAMPGPAFTLLVGHDTNLALIGGALGLHWQAPQFARDDPPPGSALVFERWHNAAGRYRLIVRLRSQSLDEMRNLTPPGPGAVQALAYAPCAESCTVAELGQAVTSAD